MRFLIALLAAATIPSASWYTATNGTKRLLSSKLADTVSVKDFGATGDGATNDTAAFTAAITYCKTLAVVGDGVGKGGCTVYVPPGVYKVSSINMSNSSQQFYQNLQLVGAGRWATTIVPSGAGNILIDMIGTNHSEVRDLSIDSGAFISQTGILLARSTTSTQANNNRIQNVHILGNFSLAAAVSLAAESTHWDHVRFENTGAGGTVGDYVGFYTAPDNTQIAVSSPNGTVQASSNTDNRMTDCEFYAPHTGATLSYFNDSAAYRFTNTSWIAGTSDNVKLVYVRGNAGAIFGGPMEFYGPHFEVFGAANTAIWLETNAQNSTFKGLRVFGGYFNATGTPAFIDYDRTNTANRPFLADATITGVRAATSAPDYPIYLHSLTNSHIDWFPFDSTTYGSVRIFSFYTRSVIRAGQTFAGVGTADAPIESYAAALPTTGTYAKGQRIWNTAPSTNTVLGWLAYGQATLGTLNGGATTADCTINTNVLTLNSATGLSVGERINIVGIGGPRTVTAISGTTAYLLTTCNAGVAAAAVSYDTSLGGLVPFGTVGNGTSGISLVSVTQAALFSPPNGTLYYCSDCNTASACTGGGSGALASRQNGAWKCL